MPTLNAEQYISRLITSLYSQTIPPDEIIIVDSESDDATIIEAQKFPDVKILTVQRSEFDHGRTRDIALRQSTGSIIIFITQDAIPADSHFI